jgi:hypothetical protein
LSIQIFSRLGPYVNTSFPLRRRPHRPLGQSEWQLERSTSTHPNCNLAIVGDHIRYFAGVLYYVQDFTTKCALLPLLSLSLRVLSVGRHLSISSISLLL